MNQRIEMVVRQSGLTKAKFAERIGVSAPYVTMLCSGTGKPSDRTITDICREFGCDEIWLRTGEGEPFRQETRQELIMRFAAQTIKGSNEFRKALVAMLATLDDKEWESLENLLNKLSEQYKKD